MGMVKESAGNWVACVVRPSLRMLGKLALFEGSKRLMLD
jgi:hypothetical protein